MFVSLIMIMIMIIIIIITIIRLMIMVMMMTTTSSSSLSFDLADHIRNAEFLFSHTLIYGHYLLPLSFIYLYLLCAECGILSS